MSTMDFSQIVTNKDGVRKTVYATTKAALATAVTQAQNDQKPTRPDINLPADGNKKYSDFN